jgi:hypothetical protein
MKFLKGIRYSMKKYEQHRKGYYINCSFVDWCTYKCCNAVYKYSVNIRLVDDKCIFCKFLDITHIIY